MHELPTELYFEIIVYLQLRDLVAARGINSSWRNVIKVAPLHPARRKLLAFYDRAINSPAFLRTRPDIVSHLQPFDRQAWLNNLAHFYLPDDFTLWILEWPALAVTSWLWPGLPMSINYFFNNWTGLSQNMLSGDVTCVATFTLEETQPRGGFVEWEAEEDADGKTDEERFRKIRVTGLELRYHGCGWITLLVLAGGRQNQRGTIHVADHGIVLDDLGARHGNSGAKGWVEYLHKELDRVEDVFEML